MRGALEGEGRVAGVLADALERAAVAREHRGPFMEGNLAVVSPYDPLAGFNAGNAMQRNKLIYALADAALVVSSDYQKGGTWTGAVEQLEKHRFVPVYLRSQGELGAGLEALRRKGGIPWPEPETSDEFRAALEAGVVEEPVQRAFEL
jgi:predicted Rossmann fold nucleotide-binding protein DprA/Smf involved in DNA uptake